MRRLMIALAASASLSGCVSAQQLGAQDDAKCQSWGAKPYSDVYVHCREHLNELRAYQNAQARAAFAAALANTGQMYQQRAAQAAAAAQAPPMQTCHTILDPGTNTATTHCY